MVDKNKHEIDWRRPNLQLFLANDHVVGFGFMSRSA